MIRPAIALMLLLSPAPALGWTENLRFETGAVDGDPATGTDACHETHHDPGPPTVFFSDETRWKGLFSARFEVDLGEENILCRRFTPLPKLGDGEEIWATWRAFWPEGFDWTAKNDVGDFAVLKFFRLNFVEPPSSDGAGSIVFNLARQSAAEPFKLEGYSNVSSSPDYGVYFGSSGTAPAWDQWESYTLHAVLDDLSEDMGGMGRVEIWRNGTKLITVTDQAVLPSALSLLDSVEFFGFWIGGAPQAQSAHIDEVRLSSDGPPPACGLLGIEPVLVWFILDRRRRTRSFARDWVRGRR